MDNNQNNNSSGSSYNNYNYTNANQNGNGNFYTSGNQQNSWSANTGNGTGGYEDPKQKRPKKERKKGGFGIKLAKCVAIALVFGLVGGSVFAGTNYAFGKIFKNDTTQTANVKEEKQEKEEEENTSLTQSGKNSVESTSVSNATVVSDVSDIVSEVMPSIVAITNMSEQQYQNFFGQTGTYESESCGSGIIVSQNDDYLYIATNNHVVEGASKLTVQFIDDSTVAADVKGVASSSDLAVVQVAKSNMQQETLDQIKVATLGNSDELQVGEGAIAIGNALGYGQSVTTGVISALDRSVSIQDESTGEEITNELIQTDAAINPGNSGGALLNMKGEVIGINEVKYSDTQVEGMGYSIPISKAAPIIDRLINREAVDSSAYIGINGVNVTSQIASAYKMPIGIYVAQVVSGSPSEAAGILQGDIITEFDGSQVKTMSDLKDMLGYYAAGTQVEIKLQRPSNGQYTEQTVTVTLGSKPE